MSAGATVEEDADAAWSRFYDAVEEARTVLMSSPRLSKSSVTRAEAHAALLETLAMSYNIAYAPRRHPARVTWETSWHSDVYTIGLPCRDFKYGCMVLDGTKTYRLTGSVGASKLFLVQGHSYMIGDPRSEQTGSYDLHDFEAAADGSFEIIAGSEPHDGNWIRLDPGSRENFFLIRDILADWGDDPGELHVELLDGSLEKLGGETGADAVTAAIGFFAHHVKHLNLGFYDLCSSLAGGKNQFGRMAGAEVSDSLMGSPATNYDVAVFEVDPEEALLFEFDPPDSKYWSLQVGDILSRALDFRHRQTDINMHRAVIDDDGRVRIVLAPEDPGVANWLDTEGRLEGVILMRSYGNRRNYDIPSVDRVKLSTVRDVLGAATTFVTADERRKALEARRMACLELFGH